MMYAMTLSRSFSAIRKFGIVGWDVWSQTASARPVIPCFRDTRESRRIGIWRLNYGISYSVAFGTICTRKRKPSTRVTWLLRIDV